MIGKEKGPAWARSPPRRNPNVPAMIYPVQGPHIVATHTFADAPTLDILLSPGGMGLRVLDDDNDSWIPDFIAARFDEVQYLLSVCTGSASLAQLGVLKGRQATTNKAAWAWATQFGEGVNWVPSARWVEDGKIWSSLGVSAGKPCACHSRTSNSADVSETSIDMSYAFFKKLMGAEAVDRILNAMEYTPHVNEHWDPFSVVHKVRFDRWHPVLHRYSLLISNSSCRFPGQMLASHWASALAPPATTFGVLEDEDELCPRNRQLARRRLRARCDLRSWRKR